MKIWVFFLLATCLTGMGASYILEHDAGYVMMTWNGYTLETSAWFFCVLLAVFSLLVYWALRLILLLLGRDGSYHQWRAQRRLVRARRYTTRGLLSSAQGDWARAERLLSRSADNSETPLINYLEAARAANAQGDHRGADSWLKAALRSTKGADLAVGLTQIELLFERGNIEQALAVTSTLRAHHLRHPQLLKYHVKAYQTLEDWVGLRDLIPSLKKANALPEQELADIEHKVCIQLLERTVKAHSVNRSDELTNTFEKLPRAGRQSAAVVAHYVRLLIELDDNVSAERALRLALKSTWDDELVRLYGLTQGSDSNKQLLFAKQYLKSRTNDATLLLALGRLAIRANNYSEAREYLTTALSIHQSAETHIELGRALALEGNEVSACEHFLKAAS